MKKIIFSLLCILMTAFVFSQEKEELKEKANISFAEKNYKECLKLSEKALKKGYEDFEFYELKGHSLMELKEYAEAYALFNLMVEKFPKEPLAYHHRANFYLAANEIDPCVADFMTSNELTDNDSLKLMNLGNIASIYSVNRRFKEAHAIFLKCLEQDPNHLVSLVNISVVCGEMGQLEESVTYLERALKLRPDFTPIMVNLGFTYQKMEKHEKAVEYFDKVLKLTPDDAYAYNNRSYSYLKLGRLKEAMQDVDKSLKLNEHNSYAYRNKALIYIEKKELDKACENIQIAVEKDFVKFYGYEILELQNEYCTGKR